jgi:Trk K+ transport system NAD-binding subunit
LRAKIIGAGSIGNHLARALRSHAVGVDLVDTDGAALVRARDEMASPTRRDVVGTDRSRARGVELFRDALG